MIVQCKACGKTYKFDHRKMVKDHMVLECKSCENPIEIVNPLKKSLPSLPLSSISQTSALSAFDTVRSGQKTNTIMFARNRTNQMTEQNLKRKQSWTTGLTISKRLLLLFTLFIIAMGSILTFVYMKYVPALMHKQINLRTFSISASFSAAIQQPLLVNNYLLVNKITEANARLPSVAYVVVINKKGVVVAGIIGDQTRFTPEFVQKVEKNGFPQEIATLNRIPVGKSERAIGLSMGGQKIHDVAVSVGDTGGESHVGLFVEDADREVRESLTPLIVLLAAMALIGGISFFIVAKTISTPIRTLTQAAERISLGDIDAPIEVKTKGEIGELATALERLRSSIKLAINRLQKNGR
jgi:HAMP domain-containing protein